MDQLRAKYSGVSFTGVELLVAEHHHRLVDRQHVGGEPEVVLDRATARAGDTGLELHESSDDGYRFDGLSLTHRPVPTKGAGCRGE